MDIRSDRFEVQRGGSDRWLNLFLLVLYLGTPCLGDDMKNCKMELSPGSKMGMTFHCHFGKLTDIPTGIPANISHLKISNNPGIRNLTHIPSPPNLESLQMNLNNIETVSWISLRKLPSLSFLCLSFNRIAHVNLGVVIGYLPKLKFVDLANNRLTSFSENELGLPYVHQVNINCNPLICDCTMLWLIEKMTCLKECPDCYLKCEVGFLPPKFGDRLLQCNSPNHLQGLPLENVNTSLMSCAAQESPSTAVVLTDGLVVTTAKLTIENLDAHKKNTAPSDDIQTKTFEPSMPNSTPRSISLKEDNNEQISTVHIIIIALVAFLAFIFMVAMTVKVIKLHRSRSSEEDDNSPARDNIALQNIRPLTIVNTAYHGNCNAGTAQQQQGSTALSLAQIVPPIPNTMYHRQRNTGFPQPPADSTEICVAQIVPPIENTAYSRTPRSNDAASARVVSASVSEREAGCRRLLSSRPLPELPSAAGPRERIDENTGEGTDYEHDYENTHYNTYTV